MSYTALYDSPRDALTAAARAAGIDPVVTHDRRNGWSLWVEHTHDDEIEAIAAGLRLTGYRVDRQLGYMERISISGVVS